MPILAVIALVAAAVVITVVVVIGLVRGRDAASARTGASPSHQRELEQFRQVVDALPIGLVLADADGGVVARNATARALAGTHAGVLVDEAVERHLAGAHTHTHSEELLELYGPPKMYVVVRAAELPGGGAYALIEDVTERRRVESVRTDFVANISHELKTPVGALAVLAETLEDEQDPEIVTRLVARMLDEAHRASRTIDDLLELSRIELGGDSVVEDVDVASIVDEAVERGLPLAAGRGIEISRVGGADGLPRSVPGDRRQLVSAVGNLVENAVKYSDDGGSVHVRVRRSGSWLEFLVVDQGVGIPPRDLDRIFERFYRVDKARSRGTGGSGLGLSIVRHVATNHGGEVLVSSREGEGSTFVLRLPLHEPAAVTEPIANVDLVAAPDADHDHELDAGADLDGAGEPPLPVPPNPSSQEHRIP